MTPDAPKVCPFMSMPDIERYDNKLAEVYCIRERCEAWQEGTPESYGCEAECDYNSADCKVARTDDTCAGCNWSRVFQGTGGFCKMCGGK